MLSLEELRRAVPLLETRLRGHRVQAIAQPDATRASCSRPTAAGSAERTGAKHRLRALVPPRLRAGGAARAHARRAADSARLHPVPARPRHERARSPSFRLIGDDRQLAMRLARARGDFEVLLAIFGRRSNVVLLDRKLRVVAAHATAGGYTPRARPRRRVGPLAVLASRRPIGEDRFADVPTRDYLYAIEEAYADAADSRGE